MFVGMGILGYAFSASGGRDEKLDGKGLFNRSAKFSLMLKSTDSYIGSIPMSRPPLKMPEFRSSS